MPYFSAAWRTAGAGSTVLPIASINATATVRPRLVEVGCFNTSTSTTVSIALRRLITSTGAQGAGQVLVPQDDLEDPGQTTVYNTHTTSPGFVTGALRVATLAAFNGVIWTFQEPGIVIPPGVNNGVALIPWVGTGQICDISFTWIE